MPDELQRKHEKFAAEKIVELCGQSAMFDRFGDPDKREPDIIFSAEPILGIEVTLAFYSGDEDDPSFYAREEWKFARDPTFDEHRVHRLVDPKTGQHRIWDHMEERLASSCQLRLNDKCSKVYEGVDRLWLAIYAHALMTESYEIDSIIKTLTIPNINPFERIFILHITVERGGG